MQHSSHNLDYGSVDQLLPLLDDGLLVGEVAKKGNTRWQVWISAPGWKHGTYCIQIAPQTALELVKYQHIFCQLFTAYPMAAALRYDKFFWQVTAMDKLHNLHWDVLKEDVLVWCVTHQPFHAWQQPVPSRLTTTPAGTSLPYGVTPADGSHHMEQATHNAGQVICRRFNYGKCNKRAECYLAHRCLVPGCDDHQGLAMRCTSGPVSSSKLQPLYNQ